MAELIAYILDDALFKRCIDQGYVADLAAEWPPARLEYLCAHGNLPPAAGVFGGQADIVARSLVECAPIFDFRGVAVDLDGRLMALAGSDVITGKVYRGQCFDCGRYIRLRVLLVEYLTSTAVDLLRASGRLSL